MGNPGDRFQQKLDLLTRRWWFYLVLLLFTFIPSYAAKGFAPRHTTDVIKAVLRHPFIYEAAPVFIVTKLLPVLLISLVFLFRNRFRSLFHIYFTLLLFTIAVFQNSAATEQYGFVFLTGNALLMSIVGLCWLWEAITKKGDYIRVELSFWKWLVIALALLAFWFPVNSQTGAADFNPVYFVANESTVTGCMVIPIVLAVLLLYFPHVNLVTLRVTGYVGILFGVLNALTWFALNPSMWWMGVMHLPLLIISMISFILSFGSPKVLDVTAALGA